MATGCLVRLWGSALPFITRPPCGVQGRPYAVTRSPLPGPAQGVDSAQFLLELSPHEPPGEGQAPDSACILECVRSEEWVAFRSAVAGGHVGGNGPLSAVG